MDNGLIPHRYARALYKYSLERGNASAVYEEMKKVAGSFISTPDLQKVLANPFVSDADKEKLLISAAGTEVEDDYRRFVKLLLDHRREEYAWRACLAFRDIYREANHIASVKVTTAARLDETEMEKIRSVVRKAYKDWTLEFEESVDSSLIGGFVVDVDSVRMDASVSNEIEQLRLNLLRNI